MKKILFILIAFLFIVGCSNKEGLDRLEDVGGISDYEVITEGDSIAVIYSDSALGADSYVSSKMGYPNKAMEILEIVSDEDYKNVVITSENNGTVAISSYFDEERLNDLDFEKWDKMESEDAHRFYIWTSGYHIRNGIWNELSFEKQSDIGDMNKDNANEFWKEHGYAN